MKYREKRHEDKAIHTRRGGCWASFSEYEETDQSMKTVFLAIRNSRGAVVFQEVHALRFENGREWDCYNGWRQQDGKKEKTNE